MELLLARAEVAPADLMRLPELEAHLQPIPRARHVAGLLVALGLHDAAGLDRFRQVHQAFEELHAGAHRPPRFCWPPWTAPSTS